MALTKINNNTLSAITGLPAGVGGKVLQVVYSSTSTAVSTTGTTLIDTGLTGAITPSSTSSKVLVLVNHADNNKNGGDGSQKIQLFRGTTSILQFALNLNNTGSSIEQRSETGCNFLDTPNTTSATTYKTQMARNGSGGTVTVQTNGCTSTMTLMEIAG